MFKLSALLLLSLLLIASRIGSMHCESTNSGSAGSTTALSVTTTYKDDPLHAHQEPGMVCEEASLRMVFVLTRHGDRTPVRVFPNVTSQWPQGWGQLTGLGMQEMYHLGQKIRSRYVDQCPVLSPTYSSREVHAQSTSKDRTLMSAQAFLLGLFPPGTGPDLPPHHEGDPLPGDLQTVPIHSAARYNDSLLYSYKNCPRLSQLVKEARQSEEWQAMKLKHQPLLDKLSHIYGQKISLKDVTAINTLRRAEQRHGQPSLEGLTDEELETIREITEWILKTKFSGEESAKLAGGNLVAEIHRRVRSFILEEQEKQFVYFSGHDGTVLAFFSALGARYEQSPMYASHVAVEVYERHVDCEDELTHEHHHSLLSRYFVRFFYDDQPLSVPACGDDHVCELHQLESLSKQVYYEDWLAACEIEWHLAAQRGREWAQRNDALGVSGSDEHGLRGAQCGLRPTAAEWLSAHPTLLFVLLLVTSVLSVALTVVLMNVTKSSPAHAAYNPSVVFFSSSSSAATATTRDVARVSTPTAQSRRATHIQTPKRSRKQR
eukprot:CAMPEP_0177648382 /NCGR_PEP_ID=MMETSP0447-20121125/10797_1 /TAXON_ID=0 /ORGANISM="Stygamoeba regulata, Strain BSH-02190019" /LENGTH=545 /DNA_ID=CAMNT_0019151017 /DNA_START=99 /DNA_END=1736 /DNA_ORIENTATION=-